ncbi:hypothetical protein K458DRAFT_95905 [Lentithecium fluviatile CBS 122367]|uniref:Uncharacterized protein n=1 Tax=Lentithecium fluviatile CBS 122367 TaxID=1168545 RepID=A0A6G1JHC3_9PLEO|nr:hypothetical protein K458DRAFT_95905 [Lentithecium fluviatile CBS 122367]
MMAMARDLALFTLVFLSDAATAFAVSKPLYYRQVGSVSVGLSTALNTSTAVGFNASTAFPSTTLGTETTGVVDTMTSLVGTTVPSENPASSVTVTFPSLSVTSGDGVTGSGTGTGVIPPPNTDTTEKASSVISSTTDISSTSDVTTTSDVLSTSGASTFPSLTPSSTDGLTGSGTGTGILPITSSQTSTTTTSDSSTSSSSSTATTSDTTSSSSSSFSEPATSDTSATITSSATLPISTSSTSDITTPSTTLTTLPPSASLETLTGTVQWTSDEWITTTKPGDSSQTVVPIIFPLISGTPDVAPIIIWGGIIPPGISPPAIQLKTPELGCIQFLGLKIGNCPSEEDPGENSSTNEPSKTDSKTTEQSSSSSSSSECSSNTATFTTIECSSAGSSSSCETKTSQTVGCSVTGTSTSTGSCIASTTIDSTSICCSSTSVSAGKTVCAFETLTEVAYYPAPTAKQTSLGTAQLLSILGAYYSSYAGNVTLNSTSSSASSSESSAVPSPSSPSLPASTGAGTTTSTANSTSISTPLSTMITTTRSPTPTPTPTPSISPTPKPICSEGNNSLMGVNNEPASWCFCGGRGPFSTIDKATTSYCDFTALPTQTISLTSHSTSVDTACKVSTTTLSASSVNTYCQCGTIMAGIGTTTTSGTTYIGCQLSPSWSMLSTIAPSTTSTTEAPKPTAPYADAPGQCHIHVNEFQLCAEETADLAVEITMWDVGGAQIGYQHDTEAGDGHPLKMKSKLEALLEVTPEHRGDYIQFTLGTESWTSKDNDKGALAYCNTGGWDPRENPWSDPFFECPYGSYIRQRQMDCYFQCPWHGGASSDA